MEPADISVIRGSYLEFRHLTSARFGALSDGVEQWSSALKSPLHLVVGTAIISHSTVAEFSCPISGAICVWMNFKRAYNLPEHLRDAEGLPRNREERLLWIKRKVEEGYYESERVMRAVADAFLEPQEVRRAGDRSWRQVGGS